MLQLLNDDGEERYYLYYVLRHSRHVLGQDYHHSPSRLAQGFLVLLIREVHQPHNNTATTEDLCLHRTGLRVQDGIPGT